MFVCLFVCLFAFLIVNGSLYHPRLCLFVCLFVYLFICLFVCLFVNGSLYHPRLGLFVCLFVCLLMAVYTTLDSMGRYAWLEHRQRFKLATVFYLSSVLRDERKLSIYYFSTNISTLIHGWPLSVTGKNRTYLALTSVLSECFTMLFLSEFAGKTWKWKRRLHHRYIFKPHNF